MSEIIRRRIEEIVGVPVGSKGELVSPFMDSLAGKALFTPRIRIG